MMRALRRMPSPMLITTHAVAVLLGLCLAYGALRGGDRGGSSSSSSAATAKERPLSAADAWSGGTRLTKQGVPLLTPREYQEAWDAIAWRKGTVEDRVATQRQLLRQWSLVDLRAALLAMMGSDWLSSDRREVTGPYFTRELVRCFSQAFQKNPAAAWELLESDELQLAKAHFGWVWIDIFHKDPQAYLEVVAMMDPSLSVAYASDAMQGLEKKGPGERRAFLEQLAMLPPPLDAPLLALEAATAFPSAETPVVLLDRLVGAATEAERTIALAEYLSRLGKEPVTMKDGWEKLPAEVRKETVERLFHTSALMGQSPLELISIAIVEDRLDLLETTQALASLASIWKYGEDEKAAAWALTLPAMPETEKAFRVAVKRYLTYGGDEMETRNWLDALPPGWHKDRAMELMAEMEKKR